MLVNDDVNLLVLFVVTSVSIVSPTDNNNHIAVISSIYDQLGDSVDGLI